MLKVVDSNPTQDSNFSLKGYYMYMYMYLGIYTCTFKVSGGNFGHGVTTERCPPFRKELNIQLNFCMITTYEGYNKFSSYSRTTNHLEASHVQSYMYLSCSKLPHLHVHVLYVYLCHKCLMYIMYMYV